MLVELFLIVRLLNVLLQVVVVYLMVLEGRV